MENVGSTVILTDEKWLSLSRAEQEEHCALGPAKALSQLNDVVEGCRMDQLRRMARHTHHRAEVCCAKHGCEF